MSEKTIELVITTTKAEKNLKQIQRLTQTVEKSLGKINKIKINVKADQAQKKLEKLNAEIQKGQGIINKFLDGRKGLQFGKAISTIREEMSAVRLAFDSATKATDRQNAASTLLAGNFKKLRLEAVAFAQASGGDTKALMGNVSARIKEIQQFPRTILAGNEAMSLLKRMQEMTIVGSKDFLEVSKAIGVQLGINANIQSQAARAANPMKSNQVFATPEQIKALGGKNRLIPPSMRLPQAGQSSGTLGVQSTFQIKNKPIEKAVKDIRKSSNKTANILSQQTAFGALPPIGGTSSPINKRFSAANLGFGRNANEKGLFAFPGGRSARIKGGIGSALIGGGFPALFGAGGISSVLGGIAGGAGGALAPGGGFAASIFATAIAAQIEKAQQFRKAIKKINDDLTNMNIQSQFSRQNIKQLARDFEITNDEALKLAETIKTFGAERGLGLLRAFGSIETFKVLAGLQDTGSVLGKIEQLQGQISEEKRRELLQTLATKGPLEAQLALEDAILQKNRKRNQEAEKREKKRKESQKETATFSRGIGSDLDFLKKDNTINILDSVSQLLKKGTLKITVIGDRENKFTGIASANPFQDDSQVQREFLENTKLVNEQLRFLAEFRAPADELKEMLNPMRQILDLSVAIRDGFQESFSGIIKGTMTVGEAFRNMLNRIADHFLDTAARMAATQIQKGFLGLFSNMFNFGTTSRANQFLGGVANPFGGGGSNSIPFGSVSLGSRADGGPVRRGNSFIVGERGPELFSPGVSGMITPNEMLGGGSTNIVVNVDASGSSVEGDEQGGRELGRVISAAVQSEILNQKRPGGLLA